ncbi:MAG: putative selenium-dependent hydroxylase accessory protein YqeC, partial [Firmicutes bacterium]|nr:putative selenium-dependent hydroxylase accessory protein YqeC [Bacillota bacterium]
MMICITGAGGKTSLLYALADRAAAAGKRVVVSTTTHIFQPAEEYAYDWIDVLKLWKQVRFAVVGTPCEGGKLKSPSEEELAFWDEYADLLLLEADGSKHLPLKVPASHEPVVPAACR